MARTKADTQDALANFFESVASAVEKDGGIFLGQQLTKPEARIAATKLRALREEHRNRALAEYNPLDV